MSATGPAEAAKEAAHSYFDRYRSLMAGAGEREIADDTPWATASRK
jgi:hypothetical protein